MSGTLKLENLSDAIDTEIVDAISDLLARARGGELLSFAYAVEVRGGAIASGYSGTRRDHHRLCGAMEQLKLRVLNETSQHPTQRDD